MEEVARWLYLHTYNYREELMCMKWDNLNCKKFLLCKFVTVCVGGKLERRDREVNETASDHIE